MAKVKVRRGLEECKSWNAQNLNESEDEGKWAGQERHHILLEGLENVCDCGQSQAGAASDRTWSQLVGHLSLSPWVRKHLKGISYWNFARIRYFLIFSYVFCFMGNVRCHDLQHSQQGVSSPWTPMNSLDSQHCGPTVQYGSGSIEVWQSCGPICS